jgi:hypothetical protein
MAVSFGEQTSIRCVIAPGGTSLASPLMRPGPVSAFSVRRWTNGLYRAECAAGDRRIPLETEALS